ncbi:hypothetical protein DAPPUDRAFT_308548 [Daphnia pulex]|uniref:Uncharacterized protein n=1 Tax=Daphnia pulex TaxID=6669 RepID=E9H7Y9_DAPPU|nr:hypothetical protein DAPPUDRAFT_308548 [Daphnia pulex]|eukprot:EFX72113.1 hypothetical protein DAPPUDRAFT_308548 [Daphnia pulex]
MYRIHQHKLVVVQIETHKSYIKMNNNNNQLKNIYVEEVFFLITIFGCWLFGFSRLNEMKQTERRGRKKRNKPDK